MKSKRAKKIATWIIVPLMAGIFILDIITVAISNSYYKKYEPCAEAFGYENGDDRIHFLSTGASDAILIESNGKFAMIDSGEGDSNPRRKNVYEGYEDEVIAYLKKAAADSSGKVTLDFVLGTHYHYDHIGAFPAIIADSDITVIKGYFKPYDPSIGTGYESGNWQLGQTYESVLEALRADDAQIVSQPPEEPFAFGDFTVQFYNTVNSLPADGRGENAASIGVRVSKGGKTAFLAADITSKTGLEKALAPEIGDIDLLKIGHHGYFGSSSMSFLKVLKPEIAVVTNRLGKIYPNVKWNLTMYAHAATYDTYDNNGLIAAFTDSGEIVLTNCIH